MARARRPMPDPPKTGETRTRTFGDQPPVMGTVVRTAPPPQEVPETPVEQARRLARLVIREPGRSGGNAARRVARMFLILLDRTEFQGELEREPEVSA